jgi:hypothetical protein
MLTPSLPDSSVAARFNTVGVWSFRNYIFWLHSAMQVNKLLTTILVFDK